MKKFVSATALVLLAANTASAACVNRFLTRTQRSAQHAVTLLTGKLTFQEAQELAKKMEAGQAPPLEWVNDAGKVIAKQMGDLKVVRPMPVGCDGKTSGVVMIASFLSVHAPSKKMNVKLDPNTTVVFEEQVD